MPAPSSTRPARNTPGLVRAAGAMVCVQAAAGVAFVVAVLAGGGPQSLGNRLGEAGYFVLLTAGVLAVAIGLLRGARWSRTPAVVVELVLIGAAWYALFSASRLDIGVPLAAYCVTVLVLLARKPSRDWAADDRGADPGGDGQE